MKKYLVIIMIFVTSLCGAQDMLTTDTFKKEISRGIVVVEFWAGWNDSNSAKYELSDCSYYLVDISKHMDLQMEFDITAIPTVIVFESGEEKDRFKANIMFELDATKKDVQKSIDKIMLAKFN